MAPGWFHRSYAWDWALAIILVIVSELGISFIPPYCRYFTPTDPTIGFPELPDEAPIIAVTPVMIFVPIISFLAYQQMWGPKAWRKWNGRDLNCALLALLVGFAFTSMFTSCFKVFAGRLRPNFLARLKTAGFSDAEILNWRGTCDSRDKLVIDGRKSFPSGHSAYSFAAMTTLTLYWCGKLGTLHPERSRMWKSFLCLLPLIAAFVVSVTRTRDYHHNFSDIMAGSTIGLACAYFGYFMYYPSLQSEYGMYPFSRKREYEDDVVNHQQNWHTPQPLPVMPMVPYPSLSNMVPPPLPAGGYGLGNGGYV